MAREYAGSPKPHHLESNRKRLTWILAVSALCIFFYVLGAWQITSKPVINRSEMYKKEDCDNVESSKAEAEVGGSSSSSSSEVTLDFESHHQLVVNNSKEDVQDFPPCDMFFSEYTPCQDRPRGRKFSRDMHKYRERHCPNKEEMLRCLIPAPPNYKSPFKWPESRDYAWFDNIPHKELSVEKAIQNWIQVEGDRFRFPGGGTMFMNGADAYIDDINQIIPNFTNGTIRTAIDTGCGVSVHIDSL